MHTSNRTAPELRSEGTVCRVDTINRELAVRAGAAQVVFDVPPGCPITLNGERVKLRLIQPHDRVEVHYVRARGLRVARAITVRPVLS
jgi:hypothetical protein